MIRGIHYVSAEVKPKLMSSQGAALRQTPCLTPQCSSKLQTEVENSLLSFENRIISTYHSEIDVISSEPR